MFKTEFITEKKMEYKYELHCHTAMVSKCAKITPEELCRIYREKGYSGIVITEHYNPRTFIDRHIFAPQKDIEHYLSSYYELKKYEDEDFRIFLGIEVRHHLTPSDFLIYGVEEDWLRQQGNMLNWWNRRRYGKFHKAGCLVFQAHPFRQGFRSCPSYIDGVEVYNGKAVKDDNLKALNWAKKHNKLFSSGSDCHRVSNAGKGGIISPRKINNNRELIELIKSGDYKLIESD